MIDLNIMAEERNKSILHRDFDEILKRRVQFSVFNLFLLVAILCITAFFAGTQTAGVFNILPRAAMFGTQTGDFRILAKTSCEEKKEGAVRCDGKQPQKCVVEDSGKYWNNEGDACGSGANKDLPECDNATGSCKGSADECHEDFCEVYRLTRRWNLLQRGSGIRRATFLA